MMFYILCAMSSTNKKSLKRGLTPSRKNRRHQSRQARRLAESRRLDALDEMSTRCRRAIALASLLEACGQSPGAEPLAADMVTEVGGLIRVEVRAMQALLETFWREAAQ
jgi:hypothetical protein